MHRDVGWQFGFCFFFFQAEDGIRDVAVTGVQTCALPISFEYQRRVTPMNFDFSDDQKQLRDQARKFLAEKCPPRSEERRVGKECRSRRWPSRYKKKMSS